jgi:hypothetical protein
MALKWSMLVPSLPAHDRGAQRLHASVPIT